MVENAKTQPSRVPLEAQKHLQSRKNDQNLQRSNKEIRKFRNVCVCGGGGGERNNFATKRSCSNVL